MGKQLWVRLALGVILGIVPAAKLLATVSIAAAAVQEAQYSGNPSETQYTVTNQTTSPSIVAGGGAGPDIPSTAFDISIFLSTTTGNTPTTTNANWTAEVVNATSWTQGMGVSYVYPYSWQTYTGKTYTQAFPSNPTSVNGYYLAYTVNPTTGAITLSGTPIDPGQSEGGFFFDGSPSSTFFVAGPADGSSSFAPGSVITYGGTSTDTPEPATFGLIGLAAAGLIGSRRRVR
jgi:hypothetical protein